MIFMSFESQSSWSVISLERICSSKGLLFDLVIAPLNCNDFFSSSSSIDLSHLHYTLGAFQTAIECVVAFQSFVS